MEPDPLFTPPKSTLADAPPKLAFWGFFRQVFFSAVVGTLFVWLLLVGFFWLLDLKTLLTQLMIDAPATLAKLLAMNIGFLGVFGALVWVAKRRWPWFGAWIGAGFLLSASVAMSWIVATLFEESGVFFATSVLFTIPSIVCFSIIFRSR